MSNVQLRCIGCQAIGFREVGEGAEFPPCPKCGCCLTDWIKIPGIKAKPAVPKAAFFEQRKPEHLEGDMRELNGDMVGFGSTGRRSRLDERDDFAGL